MYILLISPLYHPAQSPNVYRWDAIARHWTNQGHEVHWLCTHFCDELAESKINGIFVHRTGHHTLLDGWYNLLGIRSKRRGLPGSGLPRQNLFRQFFEGIINLTWRKFYWPDGNCLWYYPARLKALKLMALHNFDAVISVSLPFTAARIAQAVKEKYPSIHWLMDIEDPFSFVEEYFINNRALYHKLNTRAEERALRLADTVSVTVEAARKRYITHFPFVDGKIFVTPPLYEEIIPAMHLPDGFCPDKDRIHLGYFGTFYYPIRSPEGFLRLLSQVKKENPELANCLTVHFVGTIPIEFIGLFDQFHELSGMLQFYGLVSREQTAGMMKEMDFLINIGNITDYHLPSKCAEYLMSGKPIINIASIANDSFAGFMASYPLFLNLFLEKHQTNPRDIDDIATFLNLKKGEELKNDSLQLYDKKYGGKELAASYMFLMIETS